MAMIVQHNMTAMNANRQLGISTGALAKSTEKLSSGYRINRAADDAAGLAISEKMRSQIRGLQKASVNASDGISMIQTAEGALGETHSILQRMRELMVQASNGTETDDDRDNIQDEIEQLQEEIDRIASDTEFNTMKLLDGSLGSTKGYDTGSGPKFGVYDEMIQAYITSNVAGVAVYTDATASIGGESAIWDSTGKTLTLKLADGQTYTQAQIAELVKNAKQEDSTALAAPPELEINLKYGALSVEKKVYEEYQTLDILGEVKVSSDAKLPEIFVIQSFDPAHEYAHYIYYEDTDSYELQLSLSKYQEYSNEEIKNLIENASIEVWPWNSTIPTPTPPALSIEPVRRSVAGEKAQSAVITLFDETDENYVGANKIQFTAGRYGEDQGVGIIFDTMAGEGKEGVSQESLPVYDGDGKLVQAGVYRLSLQSGKEYMEEEIEKLFLSAGVDIGVELFSDAPDEPDTFFCTERREFTIEYQRYFALSEKDNIQFGTTTYTLKKETHNIMWMSDRIYDRTVQPTDIIETIVGGPGNLNRDSYLNYGGTRGSGLGDDDAYLGEAKYDLAASVGSGVILQVGANEGQTMSFSIEDMSARALGVNASNVNASTQNGAMDSIGIIDEAIQKVSKQRSLLGAVQNRLEHTVSNLDNTAENLQAAESGIRDADMALEMVQMSKYNILQQAGQTMLAQANQSVQGVLSLLQG